MYNTLEIVGLVACAIYVIGWCIWSIIKNGGIDL